jgi:N-acetylmuramoyl-L-alanine amidase
MRPNKIILHHSATKDSGTVSWNAIRRYHLNECNWSDIGYHFGVEYISDPGDPAGSYEVLLGRLPGNEGAHTQGLNHDSIGICFIGNYDETEPPKEMLKAGVRLVTWLCKEYGISPFHIYGHRDFARKTCPGILFNIDLFQEEVLKLM